MDWILFSAAVCSIPLTAAMLYASEAVGNWLSRMWGE